MTAPVVAMLDAYRKIPCTWGREHDRGEIDDAKAAVMYALGVLQAIMDDMESVAPKYRNAQSIAEAREVLDRCRGEPA